MHRLTHGASDNIVLEMLGTYKTLEILGTYIDTHTVIHHEIHLVSVVQHAACNDA